MSGRWELPAMLGTKVGSAGVLPPWGAGDQSEKLAHREAKLAEREATLAAYMADIAARSVAADKTIAAERKSLEEERAAMEARRIALEKGGLPNGCCDCQLCNGSPSITSTSTVV